MAILGKINEGKRKDLILTLAPCTFRSLAELTAFYDTIPISHYSVYRLSGRQSMLKKCQL